MKDAIRDLIEGGETYAYASLIWEHKCGYFDVTVRPKMPDMVSFQRGWIRIRGKVGSDSLPREVQNTWIHTRSVSYRTPNDHLGLGELEFAAKMVKKAERHLAGSVGFADYAQRALRGLGVKDLIVEPGGWQADRQLVKVGSNSLKTLSKMECELISAFINKKAV